MRTLPSPRAAYWRALAWFAARGYHRHVMEPIAAEPAPKLQPFAAPMTFVLRRCRRCPELDTVTLSGSWSMEQLTASLVVLDIKGGVGDWMDRFAARTAERRQPEADQ